MKKSLFIVAMMVGAGLSAWIPAYAQIVPIGLIDCTTMSGANCVGTYPNFLADGSRLEAQVDNDLCAYYPGTCPSQGLPEFSNWTGQQPWTNIPMIKLVVGPVSHGGHLVTHFHGQLNGVPYGVVTLKDEFGNSLPASSVSANFSNVAIEMILDPNLSNPNLEVCPGNQSPATYNRSFVFDSWPYAYGVQPVSDAVCNFQVGSGTYCSLSGNC